MKALLDTNILTRLTQPDSPLHTKARQALATLRRRGAEPCLVPQNLYEQRVVCTRPKEQYGGFGMTTPQAHAELVQVKALFTLLGDPPDLYPEWERPVADHGVKGKDAHDARLVAAMNRHGLRQMLTFNTADFARFPSITVITPEEVLQGRT